MPRNSKKFIDKNHAVTFQLVHRSQKDPLVADETAPLRVLVPINDSQGSKHENDEVCNTKKKYGIFLDNEYGYLQHLQNSNNIPGEWKKVKNHRIDEENCCVKNSTIKLPSSVFESDIEETVGLLNKAAPISGPQLQLDPDIIAALDDDFDFNNPDNILEDNFVALANFSDQDSFCNINSELSTKDKSTLTGKAFFENSFEDEETKSLFTDYSLSSSIIRRNDQLTLLDDKFEKMYIDYGENCIGSLDCEEIEGCLEPNSVTLLQSAEEYANINSFDKLDKSSQNGTSSINNLLSTAAKDSKTDIHKLIVDIREKNQYDCQSILSNCNNIYNHPKLIREPKVDMKIEINSKTGFPEEIFDEQKQFNLTLVNVAKLHMEYNSSKQNEQSQNSISKFISSRSKIETLQQKKERKQAVKIFKMERRQVKKSNINAFKEEKRRQEKVLMIEKRNQRANRIL